MRYWKSAELSNRSVQTSLGFNSLSCCLARRDMRIRWPWSARFRPVMIITTSVWIPDAVRDRYGRYTRGQSGMALSLPEVVSGTALTQLSLEDMTRHLHQWVSVAAAFDHVRLKSAGAVADRRCWRFNVSVILRNRSQQDDSRPEREPGAPRRACPV